MSSTFRRRSAVPPSVPAYESRPLDNRGIGSSSVFKYRGTKPWTGGAIVTSTGLRELDALLPGGGQTLQTCILFLNEERFTDLTDTFTRYWVAQGISNGHDIVLMPEDGCSSYHMGMTRDEFVSEYLPSLPKDMHWAKYEKNRINREAQADEEGVRGDYTIIEESEEENDDGRDGASKSTDAEQGLNIAWQYRQSIQNARNRKVGVRARDNMSSVFCCSYDLGASLQNDMYNIVQEPLHFSPGIEAKANIFIPCLDKYGNPFNVYIEIMKYVRSIFERTSSKDLVVRVLLYEVDPIIYSVVMPLILSRVRAENMPICFCCTMKSHSWYKSTSQDKHLKASLELTRTCEAVFSIESFAGSGDPPPEFRDFVGVIDINKLGTQHFGQFADKFALSNRYGLKRDRRKLHIQMLHLPPEDLAQGGSSVGSGVRSGGANLNKKKKNQSSCGTSSSLLDF